MEASCSPSIVEIVKFQVSARVADAHQLRNGNIACAIAASDAGVHLYDSTGIFNSRISASLSSGERETGVMAFSDGRKFIIQRKKIRGGRALVYVDLDEQSGSACRIVAQSDLGIKFIDCLALHPNERLLAAASHNVLVLLNPRTLTLVKKVGFSADAVCDMAFSMFHLVVATTRGLFCFDLELNETWKRDDVENICQSCAFSPDERLVAVGLDCGAGILILNSSDGSPLAHLPCPASCFYSFFVSNNHLVTADDKQHIMVFNVALSRVIASREICGSQISVAAHDRTTVVACGGSAVEIYRLRGIVCGD